MARPGRCGPWWLRRRRRHHPGARSSDTGRARRTLRADRRRACGRQVADHRGRGRATCDHRRQPAGPRVRPHAHRGDADDVRRHGYGWKGELRRDGGGRRHPRRFGCRPVVGRRRRRWKRRRSGRTWKGHYRRAALSAGAERSKSPHRRGGLSGCCRLNGLTAPSTAPSPPRHFFRRPTRGLRSRKRKTHALAADPRSGRKRTDRHRNTGFAGLISASDGTRTRDLRRDRPAL